MIPRTFDNKDPLEKVTLAFNFTRDLTAGETLTGVPVMYLSTHKGVDANSSSVLDGAPQIAPGNAKVLQSVQGGALGVDYLLYAKCATTLGRDLVCYGVLPVRRIY